MDIAILHNGARETEITAWEYYKRFGARGGHSTWLTCPECGQPVVTRAMTRGSWMNPYFKHRDNNPIAQSCSLYRPGGGSYGSGGYTTLGDPIYMLIVKKGDGEYEIQACFPPIDDWAMERLERKRAVLISGANDQGHRYPLTRKGFPSGEYVAIRYGISGGSFGLGLSLEGAWPYETPLPNIQSTFCVCMLFRCTDSDDIALRYGRGCRDVSQEDRYLLAHSIVTGGRTTRELRGMCANYKEVGEVIGSSGRIRVAHMSFPKDLYESGILQDKLLWRFGV